MTPPFRNLYLKVELIAEGCPPVTKDNPDPMPYQHAVTKLGFQKIPGYTPGGLEQAFKHAEREMRDLLLREHLLDLGREPGAK